MRSYSTTLHYSYDLSKKVARYYTLQQFGRTTVACIGILLLAMGSYLYLGLEWQIAEVIGVVIVLAIGFYFWYQYEVRRRWLEAMKVMGKPEARLVVDEDSFTVSSGAGSSTIPWRRFAKIWKQPDFWMLSLDRGYMPMTIPLAGVSREVLDLIEEKIVEANKVAA